MDRLPLIALLLAACDGGAETAPPPSRVNAPPPPPPKAVDLNAFCDARFEDSNAPSFAWPEMDDAAPASSSHWTWVNVWATWCGPCVEEMPMVQGWAKKLNTEGVSMDLTFLSVDQKSEDVSRFLTKHPELKSHRFKQFADVAPWFGKTGIEANSAIPIQVFVDPSQKVRCVRMGAVNPADYDAVKAVISQK